MKKYLGPVPSTSQQSLYLLKSKMLHKVLLLISEADIAVKPDSSEDGSRDNRQGWHEVLRLSKYICILIGFAQFTTPLSTFC